MGEPEAAVNGVVEGNLGFFIVVSSIRGTEPKNALTIFSFAQHLISKPRVGISGQKLTKNRLKSCRFSK